MYYFNLIKGKVQRIILLILYFLLYIFSYGQTKMVFKDNAYLVMKDNIYLVLENSSPNAITTIGSGGNIISEKEQNYIKWQTSNTIGIYTIPFTTVNNVKIPLTIEKKTSGNGDGYLKLSTWKSDPINHPLPSNVTNMNRGDGPGDGSYFALDRFWHIDANNFSSKPDFKISFSYSDSEFGYPNTITEGNLKAQYYKVEENTWWKYDLLGTVDISNNVVNDIEISGQDFHSNWILSDNSMPLPVTLSHFEVLCENGQVEIVWVTLTEINNDYFLLEKSYDGYNYFELETVYGVGSSNTIKNYKVKDQESKLAYYRLKQVDFNGKSTIFNPKSSDCINRIENSIVPYLKGNTIFFNYNSEVFANLLFSLYSSTGQLIWENTCLPHTGENSLLLSKNIASGIYYLNIKRGEIQQTVKIIK